MAVLKVGLSVCRVINFHNEMCKFRSVVFALIFKTALCCSMKRSAVRSAGTGISYVGTSSRNEVSSSKLEFWLGLPCAAGFKISLVSRLGRAGKLPHLSSKRCSG